MDTIAEYFILALNIGMLLFLFYIIRSLELIEKHEGRKPIYTIVKAALIANQITLITSSILYYNYVFTS